MKQATCFLCTLCLLFSCTSDKTIKVTTNIEDSRMEKLVLANKVNMLYDTIYNINGATTELNIESTGIYRLGEGRNIQYVYLSPGSSITVTKKANESEFVISGDYHAEQLLLTAFNKEMSIANTKFSINEIGNSTQDKFEQGLVKRYEKVNVLLEDQMKKGVAEDLIAMLYSRIRADEAQAKIYYPQYYEYNKKSKANLSPDYFTFAEEFDFNDERFFQFDDVTFASLSLLARDMNYEDYDNMGQYYAEQYPLVDELTQNSKVAELLKFNILNDKINYSGGISGMEDQIQKFIETAKDPNRIRTMKIAVEKWAHLKVGNKAPDFSALTRNGEAVSLSDLKGKNVYIDVWATWCGPCIAEIPSLKQMELNYHGENIEFVSVSIDKESDRAKWKQFIVDKQLGGTQLMTDELGSMKMSSQYNISGIPRFMMIDAQGLIVNVDAPRPSNATAFNKMFESVLE